MRLSAPPSSATASTSLRCGGGEARAAFASACAGFSLSSNRRRRRRRHANLDCSALFDGLFGKKTASAAAASAPPPPSSTPARKKAAQPPVPKLPRAPTADDGSALPPPYEEAVLLTRPCPSGDGSSISLVYCSGGGNKADKNVVSVDTRALEELCEAVGWPKRPAAAVEAALEGSFVVASLVARRGGAGGGSGPSSSSSSSSTSSSSSAPPPASNSDQLVGLARATSDRAFNATIWDVLVHPDWQGLGLGRSLVERTTASLVAAGVGNVTLFAAADAVDFYEALGYEADPDGIRGMFYSGK